MITEKIQNGWAWISASGSPVRYGRKALLSALKAGKIFKRRQMVRKFSDSSDSQSIENELRIEGYSNITSMVDQVLYAELANAVHEKLKRNPRGNQVPARGYFGQLLEPDDCAVDGIFVRFALQEKILIAISNYFGYVPKLDTVSLLASNPKKDGKWDEAQLWHLDHDDTTTIKFFTYLTDVDELNHGPFTYLPLEYSRKVRNGFVKDRVLDAEMDAQGLSQFARPVMGKAGSAFLIDTGKIYHYGSRNRERQRIAFVATFNTLAPLCEPIGFPIKGESGLTPLQKAVLRE